VHSDHLQSPLATVVLELPYDWPTSFKAALERSQLENEHLTTVPVSEGTIFLQTVFSNMNVVVHHQMTRGRFRKAWSFIKQRNWLSAWVSFWGSLHHASPLLMSPGIYNSSQQGC
jgi:hypothetical protein